MIKYFLSSFFHCEKYSGRITTKKREVPKSTSLNIMMAKDLL
jgi:hypothetical protein